MSSTRALLPVLLATAAAVAISAQTPCSTDRNATLPGRWAPNSPDDLAMADATIPKSAYPGLLKRADALAAAIRDALPDVTGLEARLYRNIRGDAYVPNGPERYGATALFLKRYCEPAARGAAQGTLRPEEETGTWIYINVNDLGWLAQEALGSTFRTATGAKIYQVPKTAGTFKGETLYKPNVHVGQQTEAIILTADGASPYKPLTREGFLLSRERIEDTGIADMQKELVKQADFRDRGIAGLKTRNWPEDRKAKDRAQYISAYEQFAAGVTKHTAELQEEKAAIQRVIDGMSPDERQAPAIVADPNADPARGRLFVTEAAGGMRLATLDRRNFVDQLPRDAARIIVVYWRWTETDPAKAAMIREFRDRLDVDALKRLLGH